MCIDASQFDLKFTKGNSVIMPEKLTFLQKKYAQKYIKEEGERFESMVQQVLAVAERKAKERPK